VTKIQAATAADAALRLTEVALDFFASLAQPRAMPKDSKVIAANAAFYTAFSTGDFAGMERMWADDDAISCIHPGWPAIIGRATVIGSWRDILQNPERPQIVCAEPQVIVDGDSARVLCIEIVDGTALAAANHFRRVGDGWRLVHHQSSPIAQIVEQTHEEPSGQSRRFH
jgi:ketosteroid isomerase-like protein